MRRRAAAAPAVGAALVSLLALSGCSQNGLALAQQACVHVDRSVTLYKEAERTPSPTVARTQVQQAYVQLRDALPLAAAATSDNGQWNALMTAISESARVDESQLLTALQDECAVAAGSQPAVPLGPGTGSSSTSPAPTSVQNGY
jgi:hypothetical protein